MTDVAWFTLAHPVAAAACSGDAEAEDTVGADDVDGVSALEGDLGRRRSPLEEIRGNIKAAGLEDVDHG